MDGNILVLGGVAPISLPQDEGGGGGGAANVVVGSFTAQASVGEQDITLQYTGSGYPLSVAAFADGGPEGSVASALTTGVVMIMMTKSVTGTAPTYATSGSANTGDVVMYYKNSSAGTWSVNNARNVNIYTPSAPTTSGVAQIRFHDATTMAVFVGTNRSAFAPGVLYHYVVLYSA